VASFRGSHLAAAMRRSAPLEARASGFAAVLSPNKGSRVSGKHLPPVLRRRPVLAAAAGIATAAVTVGLVISLDQPAPSASRNTALATSPTSTPFNRSVERANRSMTRATPSATAATATHRAAPPTSRPRTTRPATRTAAVAPVAGGTLCEASYYDEPQNTASGEQFNPNAMTAAHRTLPLGTRIKVTNPATGKTVVVRINDRGPYAGGRCLDLSRAAFAAIANLGSGVVKVRFERL
jgi:rare lipoprotein A (peptidoglycan hydrolase)